MSTAASIRQRNPVPSYVNMPLPGLVSNLADMIGPKFVAYATSEIDPHVIESWMNGSALPPVDTQERLRLTYKISKIVHDKFGTRDMVQAWLQGANPDLQDQSAVVMIRNEKNPASLELVLTTAAELFTAR